MMPFREDFISASYNNICKVYKNNTKIISIYLFLKEIYFEPIRKS